MPDIITFGIIGFSVLFSFTCFQNQDRFYKHAFIPERIYNHKEHYRFLSHAFVHGDEMHLFFNMLGLYFFGTELESFFTSHYSPFSGKLIFLVFYTSSIYASSLPQYFKNKSVSGHVSVGASGAVNAVVFAYIMIYPTSKLGLLLLPFMIPAWIFGVVYLGISYYLATRNGKNRGFDRIDHAAHFWGASYGISFICLLEPELIPRFLEKIF
jgi:membrane associated rhomboid family serine protease